MYNILRRLKKISVCCLSIERECLYIGTEGGHIYVLDLGSFGLKDHIIYQDIVMQRYFKDQLHILSSSLSHLFFPTFQVTDGFLLRIFIMRNTRQVVCLISTHSFYLLCCSLPGDENKTNGGSVEALKEHPHDSSKVSINCFFHRNCLLLSSKLVYFK